MFKDFRNQEVTDCGKTPLPQLRNYKNRSRQITILIFSKREHQGTENNLLASNEAAVATE